MVKKNIQNLDDIIDIVKKLRDPKKGCPWDIQQNAKSLAKYTLEEAYEVVEAIESGNYNELEDELGDLLLQVIYHSVIAEEKKKFNIKNVISKSVQKMKSRHPHIFLKNEKELYNLVDIDNAKREKPLPQYFEMDNRIRYRVKSGDYLGKIAYRYGVRVSDIKRWNGLKNNYLKITILLCQKK